MKNKIKLAAIVGSTATGKSDLAVWLAKKFNGEIISADSRQVYRGMNIGTGKVTKKETGNIPHYMLDIANPKQKFSVAQFQKMAKKIIEEIYKRDKLPILCGGTGFYIQSIIDNLKIPEVKPNDKLRKVLSQKTVEELFLMLKKLDRQRSETIEAKNKIRLIRAIEIAKKLGKVPKIKISPNTDYDLLEIGLKIDRKNLKKKIRTRLEKRMKRGMVSEVKKLKASGLSWRRLEELGLEYRFVAFYLQNKLTKKEMIEKLAIAINQYARRQNTWFKKDKRIIWIKSNEKQRTKKLVEAFLTNQQYRE